MVFPEFHRPDALKKSPKAKGNGATAAKRKAR
jgi:hypothetical protein